jgi:hypothetical protein
MEEQSLIENDAGVKADDHMNQLHMETTILETRKQNR